MGADDTNSLCLVGIMDQLWFHQPILFTEPINPLLSNPNVLEEDPHRHPDTFTDSTDIISNLPEEIMLQYENSLSSESSMLTDESDGKLKEEKDRPTRVDLLGFSRARSRSQPSSRLSQDRPRRKIFTTSKSLQECTSYRSFEHLEMEEVKGLMDLGFVFRKEHLSPRMMSLVPGLNVLFKKQGQEEEQEQELSSEEEEEEKIIERPYLSEAWLIRKPKSPLLNLKAPNKAEMKLHLKSWARSVAAVVEQEC